MTTRLAIQMFALAAACGLGLLLLWLRARRNKDTLYRVKPFLTRAQENFFGTLCVVAPGCYIFPNVPASALLEAADGGAKPDAAQARHLQQKMLDFALYDSQFKLLCVIDLSAPPNDPEQDARYDHYFKSAGIRVLRWDVESKPSMQQIHRYVASLSGVLGSAGNHPARVPETPMMEDPDSGMASDQADQADQAPHATAGLSMGTLERLAPAHMIKLSHPHIWEMLSVFATEPRHLQKYLSSLLIQDRGEERAGFSYGVLTELSDIQAENDRFLTGADTKWQCASMRV